MKTLDALRDIETRLGKTRPLPKARRAWGGADVVVSPSANQNPGSPGFYPEPRHVVSPHALEISWLFGALRDAFDLEGRLDGQTKIEFFGRLANAANRCLRKSADPSALALCAAVLHEAFAICEEMDEGAFESLAVAFNNEIVDDSVDEALRTGFIGIENTRKFFVERGVILESA